MSLIDSNVPMYLVGADHRTRPIPGGSWNRLISKPERLVTDAEVLQEILQRYVAIDRREAIQPALDAILGVVDEIFPVESVDVLAARDVLLGFRTLSARDALHVPVMRRHGIEQILSFDRGFDGLPGIHRVVI